MPKKEYEIVRAEGDRVQARMRFYLPKKSKAERYEADVMFNTSVSLNALTQCERGNFQPLLKEMRILIMAQDSYVDLRTMPDDVFLVVVQKCLSVVMDIEAAAAKELGVTSG